MNQKNKNLKTMEKEIIDIPINLIKPDLNNLRKIFDLEDIKSLGRNIKEIGQLEPIKVFRNPDGTYDLLDGERRWRAAISEGINSLKAIVEEKPDKKTILFKKLGRILQTKSLSKSEEVKAIEETLIHLGIRNEPGKWHEYTDKIGINMDKIKERMRVTSLHSNLRKQFDDGEIEYTIAQSLGRISDIYKQDEVAKFIKANHLASRFVTSQFIPRVLENPDKPLISIYDIALHKERWRYGKPIIDVNIKQSTADKLDNIIDKFIQCEQILEEAAAHGFINEISEHDFYRERLLLALQRLLAVLNAFRKSYEDYFIRKGYESNLEIPMTLSLKEGNVNKYTND